MDIWASYGWIAETEPGSGPPFANAQDLYNTIDSTEIGGVPWQVSTVSPTRPPTHIGGTSLQAFEVRFESDEGDIQVPAANTEVPRWKTKSYEVWFHDPLKIAEEQIGSKDFARELDYGPKWIFSQTGKRQYSDFMSGNWAWQQAVRYNS